MFKTVTPFIVLVMVAIPVSLAVPVAADDHLDIEYAETQPLATESMLLDVVRIGNRLVAVGERGHVVVSDDGHNWMQAEHVPTRATLTTVVAMGGRLWAGGHDAVIITSGDEGITWSRQYFDPDRQQAVMDMHFMDERHGVAIGSYGLYLKTSNGGKTWSDSTVDAESDYHLNGMIRFDDGRRMIAGEAGYSYRSYDDGETWEALELPYIGSMWGAIGLQSGCVFFFGLRGHAMESCDFGSSWEEIETHSLASLSGAAEEDGFLVLAGNSGSILTRDDGAVTEHIHSSGVDFAAVLALGGGRFLLVGEDGTHYWPEPDPGEPSP